MNGWFITGTDTDAGKTALTACLLAALHHRGHATLPMKPAQTGCQQTIPDLDYALHLSGIHADPNLRNLMAPARYQPACSPHLAAEIEQRPLTLEQLTHAYQTLRPHAPTLLVEGAGGVLVPLNRQHTMLDLMHALQLPILIAARPGLGTINHTLLTINALQQRHLTITGFVFVHTTPDATDFTESDNAQTIAHFSNIPFLGTLPYTPQLDTPAPPPFSTLPHSLQETLITLTQKLIP